MTRNNAIRINAFAAFASNSRHSHRGFYSHRQRGFTLIEVLLSVALLGLIIGIGAPVYQALQVRNDLDIAANNVTQLLRRAQVLSQAADGDVSWGVGIQNGAITLFRGTSFVARDASFDEIFDLPESIVPSGLGEVVFAKFLGMPQTTGTVTLTASINEVRTITINEKGAIIY